MAETKKVKSTKFTKLEWVALFLSSMPLYFLLNIWEIGRLSAESVSFALGAATSATIMVSVVAFAISFFPNNKPPFCVLFAFGGVALLKTAFIYETLKALGLSPAEASLYKNIALVLFVGSGWGLFYFFSRILKRSFVLGVVVLMGIGLVGLVSYVAQAAIKNTVVNSNNSFVAPSFTELDSNVVDTDEFSITFPSKPRKTVINQKATDGNVEMEIYQAGDGIGMYTFSYGRLDKIFSDDLAKKQFLKKFFKGLILTAKDPKVYTEHQSDEMPFDLSYLYTSNLNNISVAHMGMVFFTNEKAYIKITLVYPVNQIEDGERRYSEFRDSLNLKNR